MGPAAGSDEALAQLIADLDLHDPLWNERFYDALTGLRECPVARSEHHGGFWTVSRYAEVADILQDPRGYSSANYSNMQSDSGERPFMMPTETDDPLHGEIRRLLNPYFLIKALQRLEPDFRATANDLIDGFIDAGTFDASRDYGQPFPRDVFFKYLLNTSVDELAVVAPFVETIMRGAAGDPKAVEDAFAGLVGWCATTLERRRNMPPQGDLLDALVRGRIFDRPLTEEEQIWTLLPVTLGGLDTSAAVIGFAVIELARDHELQGLLREQPQLMSPAVEEFTRLASPAPTVRTVTETRVLNGITLDPGERINVAIYSANRDEAEFSDASQIDLQRQETTGNRHIAFGLGPHRCLGSNLARLSIRIALDELLKRIGDIRLVPGDPPQSVTGQMRSMSSIPVSFLPR